jgi:peptidoglycan hydrolase-like protein with peptidoglycan-binding domain
LSINIVRRLAFGWPELSSNIPHVKTDLGMIAHFDGESKLLPKVEAHGHSACVAYWKQTRGFHMGPSRGWLDIGYAYMVCPCGFILEGRGYGRQQAAEAPTPGKLQNGNSRYVSCTFGLGPGEHPTAKQLEAWHDLRDWLLGKAVDKAVYGHRDFTSTDCPGDVLYALVKNGTLRKRGSGDVKSLPLLKPGDSGLDILTLRGLLFQRYLAARWAQDQTGLFEWLRNQEFDQQLADDVKAYQQWHKLDRDGLVGDRTWEALQRLDK